MKSATINNPIDGAAVAKQTICLIIERGSFYNVRRAALNLVDTKDADPSRLRLTKLLVPNEIYERITVLDRQFDDKLANYVLPSYFRKGVDAVSLSAFGSVDKMIHDYIEQRRAAADEFAFELYPVERAKAQQALGSQWKESDYPTPEDVRSRFHVEFRWFEANVPLTLKAANPDAYYAEQKKLQKAVQDAAEQMRQFMRETFASFVSTFKEKMTATADGKKHRVHETLLTKWNDFVSTFPLRDVTNDVGLAEQINIVHGLMKGVDIDQVRDDEALRKKIATTMTKVGKAIEPMLVVRTRAIDLDENVA